MKLQVHFGVAGCAVVVLALMPASGARASDSVLYGLNDATSYSHGCFGGLCLCPIFLSPDVQGTAVITQTMSEGTTTTYDVTDVSWTVGQGESDISLTGSGTYTRISDPAGWQHRLELDLSTDGGAPSHFDSGLVEGGGAFPDIAISISDLDPDADCIFGSEIQVDASPLPEAESACHRADLDHDLSVGFGDVLALIGAWGACGTPCPADLNGNGQVDFADIIELLVSWGPC